MHPSHGWLGASLACAVGAVLAVMQLPPLPPLEPIAYMPHSLCEMVEHGPHGEQAHDIATARARAGIDAYVAHATSIPPERATAIATALRRGVDDPCRLGASTTVQLELDALDLAPTLPIERESLASREASAIREPMALAFDGVRAVDRTEDVTLEVHLDLLVTRDADQRIGSRELETLGGELTVTIRDVRARSEIAVLHHTLALPEGASPDDQADPYGWMVEQLIDAAGVVVMADVGLR